MARQYALNHKLIPTDSQSTYLKNESKVIDEGSIDSAAENYKSVSLFKAHGHGILHEGAPQHTHLLLDVKSRGTDSQAAYTALQ